MEKVVLSLGGSLIVPDKIDYDFLKKFKKVILKHKNKKFIIVVGGGSTARRYINALAKGGLSIRVRSIMGVGITRLNAKFLAYFFGDITNKTLPSSLKDVKNLANKNRAVIAGALRFEENNTSDGTAAQIANHFKVNFINMTNVKGLYDKDPRKYKDAKLIKKISINEFYKIATRMKYEPGQHFVLDQHAATIIKKNNIKTFIIGPDLRNFENLVTGRRFIGTEIY